MLQYRTPLTLSRRLLIAGRIVILTLFCRPCILIFDSLHSGSRAKVAATLRDYVACEYKAKMSHLGKDRIFNKETIRGCCPKVPQQPNFSDCGIYLLQYIEAFFEVFDITKSIYNNAKAETSKPADHFLIIGIFPPLIF